MPSAGNSFRVKLEFETPPPGFASSCKYVILVKTDVCKTIYDLEHTIIRKFGFSKGATITLSLDGFVLVSQEDVHVLSNDDCISVNVHQDLSKAKTSSTRKKRKVRNENSDLSSAAKKVKSTKQKGMNKTEVNAKNKAPQRTVNVTVKKRKASTSDDFSESSSTDEKKPQKMPKCVIEGNNELIATTPAIKASKNASATNGKSSSSTSSIEPMRKYPVPLKESEAISEPAAAMQEKVATATVAHSKKTRPAAPKKPKISSTKNCNTSHITFNSSSSDSSSSECEMESERLTQHDVKTATTSLGAWLSTAKNVHSRSPNQHNASKDPGISTNVSVVYHNPSVSNDTEYVNNEPEKEHNRPTRNYSELLPSTWPPRVGDVVAYKILEMSEDYTPLISDYKEVKILEIFPSSLSPLGVDAVKVQYLWPQKQSTKREGGRFEMDLSDDDESSDNGDVILEWQSLLQPKRID